MQNPIKEKLSSGKSLIGIWSLIPSPIVVELFSLAGLDFLILDMEHGIYDQTSLDACIRSCEGANCSPLVRVPGLNASAIQSALDLGAHGIIVPQIADFNQSIAAISYAKYPPLGVRGYNPFVRAAGYAGPKKNTEGKLSNDFGFTSLIVETPGAIDNLDSILAIEHLDMVYIGVYDLSVTLGYQGNTQHPKMISQTEALCKRIVDAGKIAGLMITSAEEKKRAQELGAQFFVYKVDTNIILDSAKHVLSALQCV